MHHPVTKHILCPALLQAVLALPPAFLPASLSLCVSKHIFIDHQSPFLSFAGIRHREGNKEGGRKRAGMAWQQRPLFTQQSQTSLSTAVCNMQVLYYKCCQHSTIYALEASFLPPRVSMHVSSGMSLTRPAPWQIAST